MAKLSLLLAVSQFSLVYSLPANDINRQPEIPDERAITISTNLDATTSYSTAIESLQTATLTTRPSLTGSILTALPTGGGITKDPANLPGITATFEPLCPEETPLVPGPTSPAGLPSADIFVPLATGVPAPSIPFRNDHVVQKQNIVDGNVPIQTNKFYANFFLGSQQSPVWTHPYSLSWAKGRGGSYGMAISHTERSQFAFGPDTNNPQYFISPIGIQQMALSAAELQAGTAMTIENLKAFSVYANFAPSAGSRVVMSVPVVQGMGFITSVYDNCQPMISSGVFFRSLKYAGQVNSVTFKYNTQLEDGSQWLIYVTPLAADGVPPLTLVGGGSIRGPDSFTGLIQVTKNPSGQDGERTFDGSAGSYAINATISGAVNGPSGSYTLSWTKGGVLSQPLVMYALPHHVESFDQETRGAMTGIQLITTTKGAATAVQADRFTMIEPDLPTTIGFAPWAKAANGAQGGTGNINVGASALQLLNTAGTTELRQDFIAQTSLNSMYYSGKGLAKFAGIVYTMQTMAGNSNLAAAGLEKLKDAFNVFANNTQPEPLVYDTVWKGVVSGATYRSPTKDPGLDFGNTLYNDHHFHYGYFVYTAAVIGHLEPAWLDQGINRQWVNTLVRDYANPVTDGYFPFSRSFDWFHGHSWAKGLFESGDGKDQESTSEDTFATFALKMWGKISGDANMEARGNLQLAVQARSVRNYFLLKSDNKNQPPSFLHNKVTGILFENKVDHTTYFGSNIEYIQGIHMIPLNPSSAYTRPKDFVTEEWNTFFSNGRVDQIPGGWRGILYANLALIDPQTSYNYFASPNFDYGSLDGGASRTWYLAYSAAMLNVGSAVAEPGLTLQYPPQQQEPPQQPYQPEEPVDGEPQPQDAPQEEPIPPQPTQEEPQQEEPQQVPGQQPQAPPQQQQPQQGVAHAVDLTAPAPARVPAPAEVASQDQSADSPYSNDPSFEWADYAPTDGDFTAPQQADQDQYRNPYADDPSSGWRNYFNDYRNNALHGADAPARYPWDMKSRDYHNRVATNGADEDEWEDVLDCGDEGDASQNEEQGREYM
ncbi:Endo-1,3(4)-beta-glucanase [Ascochyta rabiei]|uniref:Glucan endo-1,3-beta-D-glucosidase 1 n=1 Tax=Didymella rabiei TaxID=5454 RepID=A0A163HPZ1_DIDRA|nr:Endo-1,3(4)-beta-glucanase [Ascochyta rabiei]KZM25404.1 glucan endo-1,3-beta-glucanase activity, C-3 substituted reducing group [Ascochyta rabiei]UPX09952.1 Endo-1,3(4)-beta-glucanase [Ascochyta rabiei]